MTDLLSKLVGKEQGFELEMLVAILENDPQGVVVIDEVTRRVIVDEETEEVKEIIYEGGNVQFVNSYFLNMFGYGWTSKLTGTPVHRFVAERFRDTHPEKLYEFFQHPRHMKLEARGHNDLYGERNEGSKQREELGAEIHLEIEVAPWPRSDGKIFAIGYIREKK